MFKASMPSNIALIKYMGKQNNRQNLPANSSLSYTLNHLQSTVTLTPIKAEQDQWHEKQNWSVIAKQRFEQHLTFLRQQFNYSGYFLIDSVNNFPQECGLASSASSFAALTVCALQAFDQLLSPKEMANLSRVGSGSSCRSFFNPWSLWQSNQVDVIDLPYANLIHHVIVIDAKPKAISSRQAHQQVLTSLLYTHRPERAEARLADLLIALRGNDWHSAYQITWQEFQDMHALFETSDPHFSYLLPDCLSVLNTIRHYWQQKGDGPIVTMDAGPNIHLLFRADQNEIGDELLNSFRQKFQVL